MKFIAYIFTHSGLYLTKIKIVNNVNDYLSPQKRNIFSQKGAGGRAQKLFLVSSKIYQFWRAEASLIIIII